MEMEASGCAATADWVRVRGHRIWLAVMVLTSAGRGADACDFCWGSPAVLLV